MRFFSFLALSLLTLVATAQSYTIAGKVDAKYDGKEVCLFEQSVCVDTAIVVNGEFKFERSVDGQSLAHVKVANNKRMVADVIVAAGTDAVVDFTVRPFMVTGGLNDKLTEMNNAVVIAGNAVNAKVRELQGKGMSQQEIQAAISADIEAVYAIYHKAIDDNKDNMFGAYVLSMVASEFYPTLGELDTMIGKVKYASQLPKIMMERENLLKAEATQPGKMFVDFGGFAVDGKPSRLSDYVGKGKYVLVDFWASWCGPCRGEIPNLVELQNKFGGDKFTVLGVNVWDEEGKFKESIVAEGINYPQIYVPQGNKEDATALYGIRGIPQIILFAPDGTIVQRDLRGDAMKKLVEEKVK